MSAAAAPFSNMGSSGAGSKAGRSIVPPEVQRSVLEWLDEDLPGDSPARAGPARAGAGGGAGPGRRSPTRSTRSVSAAGPNGSSSSPNNNNSPNGGGAPRARSTMRQKQVEKFHVFVENPDLPPVHPANSIWLYASYEYKMQCPPEDAQRAVFLRIARLVERMNRMLEASTAAIARGDMSRQATDANAQAAAIEAMMPQPPSALFAAQDAAGDKNRAPAPGLLPQSHPLQPAVAGGRFRAKGHLIFDIISTRKHIRKDFREGLPYKLGEEIYTHCERKYTDCIATCFVGLTDNPASRVGRDIFKRSEELTTTHGYFESIDYSHLFVVFPPDSKKQQPVAGFAVGGAAAANDGAEYDENNTRFLAEALSGAHDLTGSAIPGRPPPASSLRSSSKSHQQHLAQQQLQAMLAQQQAAMAAGQDVTEYSAKIAALLMAVHKQVFATPTSPRAAAAAGGAVGASPAAAAAAAGVGAARARNHGGSSHARSVSPRK